MVMLGNTVNNLRRYGPDCMTSRSSFVDSLGPEELKDYVARCDNEIKYFSELSLGRKILAYLLGNEPKVDSIYHGLAKKRLEEQATSRMFDNS
jgi:hypothetical protein